MERKEFLSWSSQVDRLSEAQKLEIGELLAGRPVGEPKFGSWGKIELCQVVDDDAIIVFEKFNNG